MAISNFRQHHHQNEQKKKISQYQQQPISSTGAPKNGTDIYGAQVLPRSTCLCPSLAPLPVCLLATKQKLKIFKQFAFAC